MTDLMNDSIVSTRIRLARNLKGIPFPRKMSPSDASVVTGKVMEALGGSYKLYKIAGMDEAEAGTLVEKHLISKELLSCPGGAVAVRDDEVVSVMLNEEDHVREQVILGGFRLSEAYDLANGLDDRISERAGFAFSDTLGYLTACPTNLGTGMRASAMIFLPALTITDTLDKITGSMGRMNITVRGVYGEGSDATGYLYQVSNQRTLGIDEREILDIVRRAVNMIADAEEKARNYLFVARETALRDDVMRAYGILSNAYTLTAAELIKYGSLVKLGAYYGIVRSTAIKKLDDLMTGLMPYGLVASSDVRLRTAEERDVYRAAAVRRGIREICSPA